MPCLDPAQVEVCLYPDNQRAFTMGKPLGIPSSNHYLIINSNSGNDYFLIFERGTNRLIITIDNGPSKVPPRID